MYQPQLIRIVRTSLRPVFLNPSRGITMAAAFGTNVPPAPNRKEKQANDHEKNPDNVARGLKAAIHNPNVSVEAKDHAAQQLKEMDSDAHEAHLRHQLGGYKATLSNPLTSPEAKKRAQNILYGVTDKNEKRVMGGYKAVLKSHRTSKEAKHHAKQVLKEHVAI